MKKSSSSNNSRPAVRNSEIRSSAMRQPTTSYSNSYSGTSTVKSGKKNKRKKKVRGGVIIAAVCVLLAAGVGAGLYFTGFFDTKYDVTLADGTVVSMKIDDIRSELMTDTFYDGITIDGIDVSGMTKDAATSAVETNQPEAPLNLNIKLTLEDEEMPVDLSSLPLESNLSSVIDEAYSQYRITDASTDEEVVAAYNNVQLLKANGASYTTAYTVNTDGLSSVIHGMLDSLSSEASDAAVTGFNVNTLQFEYQEETNGYVIDIDKAVNDTKDALDAAQYDAVIPVSAEVTVPEVTVEELSSNMGLVADTHSTTTSDSNRNHNISTACSTMDGYYLLPGQSFSFNGVIGERTEAAGYMEAGVIQGGRSDTGLGGGICQVSTMLYQSVVKSDLQVDARSPHSWPSSYVQVGTDAAVDYGNLDFAFTNTSDYPVAIHSWFDASTSIVTVQIYGRYLPDGEYITFEGEETSRTAAGAAQYVANSSLATGTVNRIRGSHDGIQARSYQIWHSADGTEINRIEYGTSTYPAIAAQYEVGVKNPDGSIATIDPATGQITGGSSSETTASSDTTSASESTSETAAATETTAAPTETTAAPTETTAVPSETEAPV